MISTISQINNNRQFNRYHLKPSFREEVSVEENKSDEFIKEDNSEDKTELEEIKQSQKNFLINYILSAIGISAIIGLTTAYFLKNQKNAKNILTSDSYKFESLKKDKDVPLLDDCKSINKNLKQILKRQLKLASADEKILEEAGNPNAASRFLLSGPPGVGKTYFSKVYAKTMDAEYMEVLFSDLNSRWAGEVEGKMSKMFNSIIKEAKSNPNKKYIVTFNEIDSILLPVEHLTGEGGGTHFASLRRQRSTFVTYMDKLLTEVPNITIIGTTNLSPKSKNLDSALMSRFVNTIEVPYPDAECINAAIAKNMNTIKGKDKFLKNNSKKLEELSKIMEDRKYSFRNLEYIVNEAKLSYLEDRINNQNIDFKIEYLENAQKTLKETDGEKEVNLKKTSRKVSWFQKFQSWINKLIYNK